jgi:hypothetical protein
VTDTTVPPAMERPDPARLIAAQCAATEDGGAQMTLHTRAHDGQFYEHVMIMAPCIADMLRRAVLAAIPDRPKPVATAQDLLQRMQDWYVPVPVAVVFRCPAAHPDDPTPCAGPIAVTVQDTGNAGADGCEYHAARLLASLDGGRVYALPDAPTGAALRVFTTAANTRPFPWTARTLGGPR